MHLSIYLNKKVSFVNGNIVVTRIDLLIIKIMMENNYSLNDEHHFEQYQRSREKFVREYEAKQYLRNNSRRQLHSRLLSNFVQNNKFEDS